ncbi:MAG TPA: hypothetical protein VNX02_01935 [Steroidobacteraceae bacterium]|jgi:hypothetical protein|nr:hypothetical protein [Steroidobacteraceae bacterium]
MSVAARPEAAGKTRTCPHCKATILESLTICPGCLHHLRFDQEAAKRQVAAASALRVEGVIAHPSTATAPWEYFVVIAVRNERGEEVTRQVVNVGALQNAEKRTFTLSVDVMPPQAAVVSNKPGAAAVSSAAMTRAPIPASPRPATGMPGASPGGARPAGAALPGQAPKISPGAPLKPPAGNPPLKR